MNIIYGTWEIAVKDETIARALPQEVAEREAAQIAALHGVTVYVGDRLLLSGEAPGAGITFARMQEAGSDPCILRTENGPLRQTRLPIPEAPRWAFVPCPILAPVIKAEDDAAREVRQSAIARARTNFEALWAAGVICTPDDEQDQAYAYDYERSLIKGTGRRAVGWEMRSMTKEMGTLLTLAHVVANGETRAENLARWEAARKAAPRGRRANGVGCTHRKARAVCSGEAHCWECATIWVFPETPSVPTDGARQVHDLLRSVEGWLLGSPGVPHAAERAAWVRFAAECFGASDEKKDELWEGMRQIGNRLYAARSAALG